MTAAIIPFSDYTKPQPSPYLLRPIRTYAQAVIDLRARRMASEPRVELPVDVEQKDFAE